MNAYFHGHSHMQAFGLSNNMAFYLSGAGRELVGSCDSSSKRG